MPGYDDDLRTPGPLEQLIAAIENYIDVVQANLSDAGLQADRDRIRERLLHPDNRYMLIPNADHAA
jgi:hypothetical protein